MKKQIIEFEKENELDETPRDQILEILGKAGAINTKFKVKKEEAPDVEGEPESNADESNSGGDTTKPEDTEPENEEKDKPKEGS